MTREEKSSCFFLKGICICMDTCIEHWNLEESKTQNHGQRQYMPAAL